MKPIQIDPNAIKTEVAKSARAGSPKAAFSDILNGVSAMGPATNELVGQWTGGNENAGAVLNAAFSGIGVTAGAASPAGFGAAGGYGAYSDYPGLFGSPRYTTQPGAIAPTGATPGTGVRYAGSGGATSLGQTDPNDPAQYQYEIMTTMNSNNLKLLELQALMQSNSQAWTTKSNILSADHRSRMSMIEKFSARG